MYADNLTDSMKNAIDETNRRRAKQIAYNDAMGIDPQPLRKKIADITDLIERESVDTENLIGSGRRRGVSETPVGVHAKSLVALPRAELLGLIESLTEQMRNAAAELQFELAARLRDEIKELKRELRSMDEGGIR
jgi:excinuclease ABC subunit B